MPFAVYLHSINSVFLFKPRPIIYFSCDSNICVCVKDISCSICSLTMFDSMFDSTPPGFVYTHQTRGASLRGGCPTYLQRTLLNLWHVNCLDQLQPTPKPHNDLLNQFSSLLTHFSALSPNVILLRDFQHSHGQ